MIGSSSNTLGKFNLLTTDDLKDDLKIDSGKDLKELEVRDSLRARSARRNLAIAAVVLGLAAIGGAAS
ncbi:MAG: hypothetical protein WA949_04655 [Phormidesmis sp.]